MKALENGGGRERERELGISETEVMADSRFEARCAKGEVEVVSGRPIRPWRLARARRGEREVSRLRLGPPHL